MVRKIIFSTVILVFTILLPIQGQEFAPVGTAVAQFLEIGMGARATAMGEAYTTLANDAGSVFWNPAGLVDIKFGNFYLAYNRWPADISIGAFAFAMSFGNIGTIGISCVYLMTDDMEVTTVDMPDGTGEKFALTNYSIGLSYGRFLTDRLSFGVTAKLVREDYMDYGYYSWAVDIGTLYRTGFRGLKLGMSILHFGPEVNFSGDYFDYSDPELASGEKKSFENYSLPINFRIGLSINVWEGGQHKIITAADMVHSNNNLEQYNWGIEYGFNQMIFFRTGYKFNTDEGGFTLGIGVNYNLLGDSPATLNYSFAEMGIIPDIHRLSVGFSF